MGSEDTRKASVLVYRHRHGEDISLHDTPELALRAAAEIVADYYKELPGGRSDIMAMIAAGNYAEALDAWNDGQLSSSDPERIEISEDVVVQAGHLETRAGRGWAAFVAKLPAHAGWRASWEFPGFVMWSKPGHDYILCATPDYHEDGKIAIEVQNRENGRHVEIEGVDDIDWPVSGRTPESYMERIPAMLDLVAALRRDPTYDMVQGGDIFDNVVKAMQNAEEAGGPEGDSYIALMERIAAEATKRAATFRAQREVKLAPMCPKCTSTGTDDIEIRETYSAYHHVVEVDEHGKLAVRNALATGCPSEHFDDGKSDYVATCRSCLHEGTPESFGLGDPSEWDWV